ncbi:MAG TPA: DMSO reductase [Chromatiales bacterium]|nr:DMSO reductase [Thiotrichales bacterium]HIP69173.1 DMSO reductase [Chromatiales bacterium]
MHPAFSVIFLTTLIGLGQGLFLALATAQIYSAVEVVPVQGSQQFYGLGSALALVLLIAGLLASFFHLGHPERAWRSAAMWRTSWLSREVIVLPVFMAFVALYGLLHWLGWDFTVVRINENLVIPFTMIIAVIGTIVCFTLFLCTGMIYASIKFLQEWASMLTVINFVLLGAASGFTLATVFAVFKAPELVYLFGGWAIVLTIAAMVSRVASLIRNHHLKPLSTPKSAIGVRHAKIRQTAQGAMGGSFNTREFFHGKTATTVKMVKWAFIILVFILPLILVPLGLLFHKGEFFIMAALMQYTGLIAERWFFFAQSNHPQNIYYQAT